MSDQAGKMSITRMRPCLLLLLVLLGAAALRFYGLDWGTDREGEGRFYPLHPDERTLIQAAALLENSFRPALTVYGTLPMYLLHIVGRPLAWMAGIPLFDWDDSEATAATYLIARGISALASLLPVWLTFRLGCRLDGRGVGLLGAALLAVAVLPIQLAHFYTVDGIFTLLAVTTVLLALRAGERGRWSDYLLCGAAIGLAIAVRINGILLLVPPGLAYALRIWERDGVAGISWKGRLFRVLAGGRPVAAAGAAAGVALLLQPFVVLDPDYYFSMKSGNNLMMGIAIVTGEIPRVWTLYDSTRTPYLFHLTSLLFYGLGPLLQAVGLLGVLYLVKRRRYGDWVVLSWVVVYFVTVGRLEAKNIRYMAPLIPFLVLAGAQVCAALHRRAAGRWRILVTASIVAVLLGTAVYALAFVRLYGLQDSRIAALHVIRRELPRDATIGIERTGVSMAELIPSGEYLITSLHTGHLFNVDDYLLDGQKIEVLCKPLLEADALVLVDVGRGNHFLAAAERYPIAAQFYRRLYDGELGFDPIASFRNEPGLGRLRLDDSQAEISFYGFDHPRVTLFQKRVSVEELVRIRDSWRGAVEDDPGLIDVHLRSGAAALQAGRFEEAEAAFERAAALRPGNVLPYFFLYETCERRGFEEQANRIWKETLMDIALEGAFWEHDVDGLFQAGSMLLQHGALSASRRCLRLVENTQQLRILKELGKAYLTAGLAEDAVRVLEQVVRAEPGSTAALGQLCLAHAAGGNRRQAMDAYRLYAQQEPDAQRQARLLQALTRLMEQ